MRKISRWAAQAGTEVNDLSSRTDACAFGQGVVSCDAAVVILIVWVQLLWTQTVKCATRRLELGENDLGGDRMALVKFDGRVNLCALARAGKSCAG
jgi:hypothetical protein